MQNFFLCWYALQKICTCSSRSRWGIILSSVGFLCICVIGNVQTMLDHFVQTRILTILLFVLVLHLFILWLHIIIITKNSISEVLPHFFRGFSGPFPTTRVLDKLYCRIVSHGVQYAWLCSITYSRFCNFPGQIHTFPFKETMGMLLITKNYVAPTCWYFMFR